MSDKQAVKEIDPFAYVYFMQGSPFAEIRTNGGKLVALGDADGSEASAWRNARAAIETT